MPRTFNRENIRKQWDPAKMSSAIDVVRKSEMGYLKASSKLYGVPQTTLERPVKKRDIPPAVAVPTPLGRRPTFPRDIKDDLKQYIVFMEQCLFGLITVQVRELAFQIAERNGNLHSFNNDETRAG
jgi:hypothetical protein